MRLARVTVVACAAAAFFLPGSVRAEDGRAVMLRDLVQIQDGRLVYDDLAICRLDLSGKQGRKFQVHSRATAPEKGLVSRDFFVALVTRLETEIALGWAESGAVMRPSAALRALRCESLEKPIGKVDVEITLTMTDEGIQLEYKDTAKGTVDRSSNTWNDVLKSE
jgi:hypothetical protein